MNMRGQLVQTATKFLQQNQRATVLLGDIGVWGFRDATKEFPDRVYNIGILEQSTIGIAAGMAMTGLVPIVHTIAPFLVERAYEQLKVDFCYQQLGGNFVSVGASYDYAALGPTHHCPGDVGILKQLPDMQIVVPGTSKEFDSLFTEVYDNGKPTYFRLSEEENTEEVSTKFGKASVMRTGKTATILVVGPMLDRVLHATEGLDVTVLYYHTLSPFDDDTLRDNCPSGRLIICTPFYTGALLRDVTMALQDRALQIDEIGMPLEFLTHYGKAGEHHQALGLDADGIHRKIQGLLS